jgi:ubiquinone/menaquinone biosynthesis C-methylase UbiE
VRTAVREIFAVAAAAYDRGNPLLALERPETQALLPALTGRDVLDLGAGTGHYARLAQAQGARLAVAVDFTLEMVRSAPKPAVVADAARLPLADASIDVVVAALLVSFVPDLEAALAEAARALRPGGLIVLSDLHPVASRKGWQRSFAGPKGERLVIDAPPPTRERVTAALEAAGLALETHREPAIDERLRERFREAGRKDFDALEGTPLLQIFRARKRGSNGK